MREDRVTAFGGIVGRVLRDSTSFGTAVTAFILGAVVVAVSFIFTFIGNETLAQILVQVIVALALARFALNGLAGEFRGTILSTSGGSWALAIMVAARYLLLNVLWMAPLVFVLWQAVASAAAASAATISLGPGGFAAAPPGIDPMDGMPGGAMEPAGGLALALPFLAVLTSKTVIASLVLILFGLTLLPPVFLIVAVRAERFADIFSGAHWRAAFSGRFADLYVIYAIHGGGIGMMIIMAIPVVALGFTAASEFGILFAFLAFGYVCGLAVTLLGRLCGFFAFGEDAHGPVWGTEPAGGRGEAPAAVAGFTPRVVPAAAPGGPAPAETGADASGRPPLLDAVERAAAARERFATDPDGAIGALRQLNDAYAPNPQVLHALALALHQAGRAAEALETARVALPLCLARGHAALAAELFAALWKQARDLGLDHEQIDAVASSLMKSGDLGRAVSAYGLALTMDPSDRRAIKGLLQAADQRLHREGKAKDAIRIYTFLLQYASGSPFAEDMRRGLSEAEARSARAS